jgi:3',5'-cyclic AMP phosphodiesterase CpdA
MKYTKQPWYNEKSEWRPLAIHFSYSAIRRSPTMKLLLTLITYLLIASSFAQDFQQPRIAFLPDIHFHDIYADFAVDGFTGIAINELDKNMSIRSMAAQIHSTRLFNENYFALITALDDIADKGIKLVALPGDFTDDGQPIQLQGLKKILDSYAKKHAMRFFAIPGNHDPVRPFKTAGGKPDFLDAQGKEVNIYSPDHQQCLTPSTGDKALICSKKIAQTGYQEILNTMAPYGLMPDKRDILWETPFSSSIADSALKQRTYSQCSKNDRSQCTPVPDLSYLVEPIEGIWLLAIDANVYIPKLINGEFQFLGSGNAGYNKVLTDKPFLMKWIRHIVKRAKKEKKTLIAFSHFPMGEFYDGQTASIQALFGKDAFQLVREPFVKTRNMLAETGLRLHIGGHMHMNDTSINQSKNNTLVNIQAPSIAAYRPAYKLVSIDEDYAKIDTITLDNVLNFDSLFPAYRKEHDYLTRTNSSQLWDKAILETPDYHSFNKAHLQALAKWRFIPKEWPKSFRNALLELSLLEVVTLREHRRNNTCIVTAETIKLCLAKKITPLQLNKTLAQDLQRKSVLNFITDFYLVRNAGSLAFKDITPSTKQTYQTVSAILNKVPSHTVTCASSSPEEANNTAANFCQFSEALSRAFLLYNSLSNGLPDRCLRINLSTELTKSAPIAC